jgi:transposase InsO family protein
MAEDKRSPKLILELSPEALLRHQFVSTVKAKQLGGMTRAAAIREAAATPQLAVTGELVETTARSIYRWLEGHEAGGVRGLETQPRTPSGLVSTVLPQALLDFFRSEKAEDRYASVPELLRRARLRGIVAPDLEIDRVSAWRACRRMDLPLRRVPAKHEADVRRFSYPHRMMMVLADGKHFRAGVRRTRRLAFFFLDDATRFGLDVVVGTSEQSGLFLRGLYQVVSRFGFLDILFLDNGSGFIAADTATACANLNAHLVLGTAGYPEGHGLIERFNQTAQSQCLRGLPGAADVSDELGPLELRLRHYLKEQYNQQPHEALDGMTPQARWDADTRALRFPEDLAALQDAFLVCESRKVSADNVLSHDGRAYEVPRGHATTAIRVWRRLLTGELLVHHDNHLVVLHPVDLAANAVDRRARPAAPAPKDDESAPTTAASLAFRRDFAPVLTPDGGYRPPKPKE